MSNTWHRGLELELSSSDVLRGYKEEVVHDEETREMKVSRMSSCKDETRIRINVGRQCHEMLA
jgi:hypothetical protein